MFLIGPNYAAGKDMLAGVALDLHRQGGRARTSPPGRRNSTFPPNSPRPAPPAPEAVFVFYPGAAGVQFLNRYAARWL